MTPVFWLKANEMTRDDARLGQRGLQDLGSVLSYFRGSCCCQHPAFYLLILTTTPLSSRRTGEGGQETCQSLLRFLHEIVVVDLFDRTIETWL
jgi:hypothetical protein